MPCRHTHAVTASPGIDVVKISRRLGHRLSDHYAGDLCASVPSKRDDKSSAAINAAVASLFPA